MAKRVIVGKELLDAEKLLLMVIIKKYTRQISRIADKIKLKLALDKYYGGGR